MAHANEELVRKGYAAFLSGDMATLDDLFADGIVWHTEGRGQLSGDFVGKEAVFANFAKIAELTGGTFSLDIHDVLANNTHAVVLTRVTAEREGKKLDTNGVQVFHIVDGKVTEQWGLSGDAYAADEFFS